MEIQKAEEIAREKFKEHNIIDWSLKFDNANRRFGNCKYSSKIISISKKLTLLNDEKHFIDTLLHEIAHILVGRNNNHNKIWKSKAIEIGCDGERCYSKEVIKPEPIRILECKNCHKQIYRYKKKFRNLACSDCCNKYNKGIYTKRFRFTKIK